MGSGPDCPNVKNRWGTCPSGRATAALEVTGERGTGVIVGADGEGGLTGMVGVGKVFDEGLACFNLFRERMVIFIWK